MTKNNFYLSRMTLVKLSVIWFVTNQISLGVLIDKKKFYHVAFLSTMMHSKFRYTYKNALNPTIVGKRILASKTLFWAFNRYRCCVYWTTILRRPSYRRN